MNFVYTLYAFGLIAYGVILLARTLARFRNKPVRNLIDNPQLVVTQPTQPVPVTVVPADVDDDWSSYIPPVRMPE